MCAMQTWVIMLFVVRMGGGSNASLPIPLPRLVHARFMMRQCVTNVSYRFIQSYVCSCMLSSWFFQPTKETSDEKVKTNPMRDLRIMKLCLNICVGESGDRLTRAAKVLEQLTGQQPVFSKGECTHDLSMHCTS